MDESTVSLLGYIATGITLFSFVLRGEKKIRAVNLVGALFFVVYGFMKEGMLPFALLNAGIVAVHIWQFWRMAKEAKAEKALAKAEARAAEAEAKLDGKPLPKTDKAEKNNGLLD